MQTYRIALTDFHLQPNNQEKGEENQSCMLPEYQVFQI